MHILCETIHHTVRRRSPSFLQCQYNDNTLMQMVVAFKDDRLSLNVGKGDISFSWKQKTRGSCLSRSHWREEAIGMRHAACDNDATLCACALRVAASHVARLTEIYGVRRRFSGFLISKISRFLLRFQDFIQDFEISRKISKPAYEISS